MSTIKALSVLLVLSAAAGFAQQKAPRPRPQTSSSPAMPRLESRYLTTPFDVSTSNLPLHFEGHSAQLLYTEFQERAKAAQKSEFETTEEYNRRIEAQNSKLLLGRFTTDDVFAFVFTELNAKYDADSRSMSVSLSTTKIWEHYTSRNPSGFSWNREMITDRYYTASNAMGASVQVHELRSKEYGIRPENLDELGLVRGKTYSYEPDALETSFPIEVEEAKVAKQNLRILLVAKLEPPYTMTGNFLKEPKFDSPTDMFQQQYFLCVRVLELWVFNAESGKVYQKSRYADGH